MIADGYHDVPAGKLANVVTYLESRVPPAQAFERRDDVSIVRSHPSIETYLKTFRRIGEAYLWFSRLTTPERELAAILSDPDVEIYDLIRDGEIQGFLELDFRAAAQCELAYFGLVRQAHGRGLGRYLMAFALQRAWQRPIERVWLHTCTLDDRAAVPFYRRNGFVPYKRQFEIADDPRMTGLLPVDCAPEVPLL
ncbi:MAG TPA: GNAT family N-acetyltransferase [Candidatus Tumulicola sp.]